jgi:hypothetical protein
MMRLQTLRILREHEAWKEQQRHKRRAQASIKDKHQELGIKVGATATVKGDPNQIVHTIALIDGHQIFFGVKEKGGKWKASRKAYAYSQLVVVGKKE